MNPMLLLVKKLSYDVEDQIFSEVSLAIEKPETYYEKFKDEKGIDSSWMDALEWIALIEALLDHELAFDLDWKVRGVYLCDVVDELLERKNMTFMDWDDFEDVEFDKLTTTQCLNAISEKLKEHQISLASLDTGEDRYYLITVQSSDIDEIKELAQEAGYTILDSF